MGLLKMGKLYVTLDGQEFPAKKNYVKKNAKMAQYVIMEFAFVNQDSEEMTVPNYLV